MYYCYNFIWLTAIIKPCAHNVYSVHSFRSGCICSPSDRSPKQSRAWWTWRRLSGSYISIGVLSSVYIMLVSWLQASASWTLTPKQNKHQVSLNRLPWCQILTFFKRRQFVYLIIALSLEKQTWTVTEFTAGIKSTYHERFRNLLLPTLYREETALLTPCRHFYEK